MKRQNPPLADQVRSRKQTSDKTQTASGSDVMISTGSTLLDLAIGWERSRRGGLPAGILVEIFGPPSSGKTTLLCEIAGGVQRKGGSVMYLDPEGRLSAEYAQRLGLRIDLTDQDGYKRPDTVPEAFGPIRKWEPEPEGVVHGIFADSLAALSTDLELADGDKMGMRRAKEFSEELRKTCRVIANKNYLLVCSNQIRQTMTSYGERFKSPGGEAIAFYSSVRLRVETPSKVKNKIKIGKNDVEKTVAMMTNITVYKSSVGEPYHKVPVFIDLAYGVDDIRANLQYLKEITGNTVYAIGDNILHKSVNQAIMMVEEGELERDLRNEVINTWVSIQESFRMKRKDKVRT